MVAELKAAYDAKEPIIMMFWEPHWIHAQYKFDWVNWPTDPGECEEKAGSLRRLDGCLRFPSGQGAEDGLEGLQGQVAGRLQAHRAVPDVERPAESAHPRGRQQGPLEDVATEWIKNNEAIWKPWVDAANLELRRWPMDCRPSVLRPRPLRRGRRRLPPDPSPIRPKRELTPMPSGREVKLSCRNLWKVYGERPGYYFDAQGYKIEPRALADRVERELHSACADVSFDVHVGEIFVIMGPSGSGKSTVVRCLSRLVEPSHGQVLLDGRNLLGLNARELIGVRRHNWAWWIVIVRQK